ncbi:hypothetical protein C8N32_1073 [Rhodovulum imhoffii]|uniref:Uncharacterized protein n=1 Tax=Rhodovulum imhoffii TaxID=365340 RepID=A0A2T5BSB5_9RHOB|nr:hypothetical protein [Rhodovulum imhoffii]MBK5933526.1 hypothetical protein [Rhodovulum imhoffii]PTN02237.1 hypothetical protein C8N32_1073 [Rhodovulum imhoffii]
MTDEHDFEIQPSGEAHRLHTDQFLNEILDGLERGAMEALIATDPTETARHAQYRGEIGAIRSLRTKLKTLAEGKTKRPARGSVA